MNEEFKKIAKKLGVVLPSCLLSIGVVNAETDDFIKSNNIKNDFTKEVMTKNLANNSVVNFLAMHNPNKTSTELGHTNRHANAPANHTDEHSNVYHSDDHTNQSAYNEGNQCKPHVNNHSNREPISRHTNSGHQKYHSDNHTDIPDARTTCD